MGIFVLISFLKTKKGGSGGGLGTFLGLYPHIAISLSIPAGWQALHECQCQQRAKGGIETTWSNDYTSTTAK